MCVMHNPNESRYHNDNERRHLSLLSANLSSSLSVLSLIVVIAVYRCVCVRACV